MKENQISIKPSKLKGTIHPPPAKAVSHRAFIMGGFSKPGSELLNVLESADTLATKKALEDMGAKFEKIDNGYKIGRMAHRNTEFIDCKNSGTTLRLLTAILSLFEGSTTLTGDQSLVTRPMTPLIDALTSMGAIIESDAGTPPIVIQKIINPESDHTEISGSTSSQYISGLLLMSSLRDNIETTIELLPPVVSRPYIDLTIQLLQKVGIPVHEDDNQLKIMGRKDFGKINLEVPADMSSAAFFIVAGAIGENEIEITNVDHELSQADAKIIDIVKTTGANVIEEGSRIIVKGNPEGLQPFEVDLSDSPDLFPILCVLAANCRGTSRIYNAEHVRVKEVDRISVMMENLQKVGIQFEEKKDGALIIGGEIHGDVILLSHHDHRIAMAASILATRANSPILIEDYDCVDVSYPNFYEDLKSIVK